MTLATPETGFHRRLPVCHLMNSASDVRLIAAGAVDVDDHDLLPAEFINSV